MENRLYSSLAKWNKRLKEMEEGGSEAQGDAAAPGQQEPQKELSLEEMDAKKKKNKLRKQRLKEKRKRKQETNPRTEEERIAFQRAKQRAIRERQGILAKKTKEMSRGRNRASATRDGEEKGGAPAKRRRTTNGAKSDAAAPATRESAQHSGDEGDSRAKEGDAGEAEERDAKDRSKGTKEKRKMKAAAEE